MVETTLSYYSNNKENLSQLFIALEKINNTPLKLFGFQKKDLLRQFLQNIDSGKKIQFIILDINDSTKETFQFIKDINQISANTLKLILSTGIHLLNIQVKFNNTDSFQYLNRLWSEIDFRIALNSVKNSFSNLQILLNHKSEVSGYPKKLGGHV